MNRVVVDSYVSFMREEIRHIDVSDGAVRRFGWLMGVIALLVTVFLVWRAGWHITTAASWVAAAGAGIAVVATLLPPVMRPVYRLWMILAVVLGFVMTRVILTIVFVGLVTPIGLVMRALGKDPLAKKPDPEADTYWISRESDEPLDPPRIRMRRYY